jgi:hypothetical protein
MYHYYNRAEEKCGVRGIGGQARERRGRDARAGDQNRGIRSLASDDVHAVGRVRESRCKGLPGCKEELIQR